jgi:hypothetical protein
MMGIISGVLMRIRSAFLMFLSAVIMLAQAPAPATPAWREPTLKPGEGFAIATISGEVHTYGEASKEAPMGGLAKLVWMQLEGAEWASMGVQFKCAGALGPFTCGNRKGHGNVDLGRALKEDCDLAFLYWIGISQVSWKAVYGDAAGRARMEQVFAPFLGRRLPDGDGLPPLTAAWVGAGDLLRTSPEGFLHWLQEPEQSGVVTFGKRFLAGNWVDFKNLMGKEDWWFKTATAPVPGDPAATSAWVVGGLGESLVVLHLPKGRGDQEGMVRIREILGLKGR